jgi:hypothetical protein
MKAEAIITGIQPEIDRIRATGTRVSPHAAERLVCAARASHERWKERGREGARRCCASAVPGAGRLIPGGRPTTKDLLPTPARDPGDGRSPAPGLCAQTVFGAAPAPRSGAEPRSATSGNAANVTSARGSVHGPARTAAGAWRGQSSLARER